MRKILCVFFSLFLWGACQVHAYSNKGRTFFISNEFSGTEMEGQPNLSFSNKLQGTVVTGTITDNNGEPLVGVYVKVVGTTLGGVTDVDGHYSIKIPDEQAVLKFSFMGFKEQTITVGQQREINVKMSETVNELKEVVVTALNISRESKSLGVARQSVNVDGMTEARETNIVNALDGKAAGIFISSSGSPTGSSHISIRGDNSISGSSEPLFVVDGVPINNSTVMSGNVDYGNGAMDINPSDVASMEVLPGANAAALYGSRAANGAIIITTKKAAPGSKYLGLTADVNYAWSKIIEYPDYQNVYGQGNAGIATQNGAAFNSTYDAINLGQDGRSWGSPMVGQPLVNFAGKLVSYVPHPDNVKDFFKAALTSNYNVVLEKSDANSGLRVSYTFRNADDIMPNVNLRKTHTLSLYAKQNFSKLISLETSLNYLYDNNQNALTMNMDGSSVFSSFIGMQRNLNVSDLLPWKNPANGYEYGTDGNTSYDNPYWVLYENSNSKKKNRIYGTVTATINLAKNFSFRGKIAPDLSFLETNQFKQMYANTDKDGQLTVINDNTYNWTYDGLFMYNTTIKNLAINALAGFQQYRYDELYRYVNQNNLIVPDDNSLANSGNYVNINENIRKKKTVGAYGSLSLGYKNYLYMDLTGRNDWSSSLPASNNSFFYPSISGSFVFSEALKIDKIISFGKIRASWAQVGNDPDIYSLKTQFNYGGLINGIPYLNWDNTMKNPNLKPEMTTSTEVGTDLTFLNGRLSLSGTLYDKSTKNQIFTSYTPVEAGYSKEVVNAGEIDNKGIELSGKAKLLEGNKFNWSIFGNWSQNNNKVIKLLNGVNRFQLYSNAVSVNAEVGQPFGVIRGSAIGRDAEGDAMVQPGGNYVIVDDQVLGNSRPKWIGSIGSQFSYKNFDFSVLVTMRWGGILYSNTYYRANINGTTNQTVGGRDYWLLSAYILGEDNNERQGIETNAQGGNGVYDENSSPKGILIDGYYALKDQKLGYIIDGSGHYVKGGKNISWTAPYNYWQSGPQEMFIFDASYVKIKQVSVGYNLPKTAFKGIIRSARISLNASNLWTIFKNTPNGIDPEAASNGGSNIGIDAGGAFPYCNYGFDVRISF
ncbi:MAG: SusC/RagA family TonB-linked outer membrane protein [Bacteroidota bacterium]|nr:SusC/RagA family TonB-linked outer membrane protein [Bacteroidota bacterium]